MPRPYRDEEDEQHYARQAGLDLDEWRSQRDQAWDAWAAKEEQRKLIQEKLAERRRLLQECKAIADEHGLSFHIEHNEYVSQGAFDIGIDEFGADEEEVDWDDAGWQRSYC